jgi:hypothetical protein
MRRVLSLTLVFVSATLVACQAGTPAATMTPTATPSSMEFIPTLTPSVTETAPTETPPPTPTKTPTKVPELTFGLPATVEQCIPMDTQINPDGTIKPEFLAGERAYLTKYLQDHNMTIADFVAKYQDGSFAGSIEKGAPYLEIPYLDYNYFGPGFYGNGVFALDCGTKTDGSIVFSAVAIPSDYPEIMSAEDVPILHLQYFPEVTQYALSQRKPGQRFLEGWNNIGLSPQKYLDMLNNQEKLALFHFGVAAPYSGIPADNGTVWDKLFASLKLASSGVFPDALPQTAEKSGSYVSYMYVFGANGGTEAGWDKPLIAKTLNNKIIPLDFISVSMKQ